MSQSEMSTERAGSSRVFDYVREQILSGAFRPGQRLNIADICQAVGTSHIPVREAIRRLEGESLVVTLPNHGAIVAEVSFEELNEIYELRRILELRLVESALPRYSRQHLDSLDDLAIQLIKSGPDPSNTQFYARHREFHWGILLPESGSWHERTLTLLWQVAERYQRLLAGVADGSREQVDHHREIVAVARKGDVKILQATVDEHLQMTQSVLVANYDEIGA